MTDLTYKAVCWARGSLNGGWRQCVVSCQGVYRGLMSTPHPKAAILAALDTLPACLKGANYALRTNLSPCISADYNPGPIYPAFLGMDYSL